MTSAEYDVVVVGSGFGGAVMACRLAEAGRSVAVLERGRRWDNADFPRYRPGGQRGFLGGRALSRVHRVRGLPKAGRGARRWRRRGSSITSTSTFAPTSASLPIRDGLGPSPAIPWNPITSGPWVCWDRSRCGRRMDGTLCPSVRACSSQPAGLPVMPQTRSRSPSTWTRRGTNPATGLEQNPCVYCGNCPLWLRRSGQEHTGLQLPGSGRAAPRRLHSAARGGRWHRALG